MIFDTKGQPKKRISLWIPFSMAAAAILLAVIIIKNRPQPEPSEPDVAIPAEIQVIEVINTPEKPQVVTTGRVGSLYESQITAQVSGLIEAVSDNFRDGASFSEGEILVQIEQQDYQLALAQSQSSLASAMQQLALEQGQAEQARREWRDLGNSEANALFLREPQLNAAKAQVEAAESSIQQAELNLQRTNITAPFDGVISTRQADIGQFVTAGSPVASMNSTNLIEVSVSLTPNQIADLGWLDRGLINTEGLVAEILYKSGQEQIRQVAFVKHISSLIDPMTQMTQVLLDIEKDPSGPALPPPGQFVDVALQGQTTENAIWLPESVLFERNQVLLANEGILEARDINPIARAQSQILVKGLEDGDLVVLERPLWIFLGQRVTPKQAEH